MKITIIDLYDHFNIERPKGANGGRLTKYVVDEPLTASYRPRPAVLVIAGGGYTHVSLRESEPVALVFSARGFNAFVLDYSVNVKFPAAQVEATLAAAYIRSDEDGIFNGSLAAVGFSAGAHLAASLGAIPEEEEVKLALEKVDYFKDKNISSVARPDALVLAYPVISSDRKVWHEGSFMNLCFDDNGLIDRLSIEKRIDGFFPPTYIWHTANDESVNVKNSLYLAEALSDNKVPFEMKIYEKGVHGLSLANEIVKRDSEPMSGNVPEWTNEAVDFLVAHGFKIGK